MAQKWNLQDIKPAEPRRRPQPERHGGVVQHPPQIAHTKEEIPSITIENGEVKKRSRVWLAIAAFIMIVGGGIIASALSSGAEITIHPHFREPNLNATFIAYPDRRADELSYTIMSLDATGERQVTATGQEQVVEQARGEIEIIKTTPGSERLIKNTRFESPNGLIYKIEESVVVPGAVSDGDGNSVPGTIRAKVFAESPGDNYNLAAGTRFTIPGFAENGFDDLFKNMYAINREAFTGGFDGPRFTIDEGELATARQALQMELRDALLARVPNERPANYVVFEDANTFTYEALPAVEYGNNLVTIREKVTLRIPTFEEAEFATYIAAATVPGYEGNPVRIDSPESLSFSYDVATTTASNIANMPSLTFNLKGKPLIIWEYDEEKLKADLRGIRKTALSNILSAYPSIDSADAVVRPFWSREYPDDPDEITITETLEPTEE